MKKLTEKERLEFAAEMEAALTKDMARQGRDGPELATIQAQIALLKDLRVPMFVPIGDEAVTATAMASPTSDPVVASDPILRGKIASLVDFLQEATGFPLTMEQRDTALAIADSLDRDPESKNFPVLVSAWKECPGLYGFAKSVIGEFVTDETDHGPRPLLH
jgi:hypothetical protein